MLQKEVREQCTDAGIRGDGHDEFWIDSMKDAVIETIKVVDCVIINDAEARQLANEPNIHKAAKKIMEIGDFARSSSNAANTARHCSRKKIISRFPLIRSNRFLIRPARATLSRAVLWAISPARSK
jgi:hypothetical protein